VFFPICRIEGSSSERFRFGADSEFSAPCTIQLRCTQSRANPRNGSIIFHDWTVPGTTESPSEDPKAELSDHSRTTIFLLERRSAAGRILPISAATWGCPCPLSARRLSDLHMSRTAKSSTNHLLRTPRPTFIKARVPNQDCQIVPTPIMSQFRARWTTRDIVAANLPQRCNVLQYSEF
jgi:hypothetical protein